MPRTGRGCLYPIHLAVGHVGRYDEHAAAPAVARRLAARPDVVAVAGIGLSHQLSGRTSPERSVPGAGGPISFDNSGNRTGDGPPVIRLCPLPA